MYGWWAELGVGSWVKSRNRKKKIQERDEFSGLIRTLEVWGGENVWTLLFIFGCLNFFCCYIAAIAEFSRIFFRLIFSTLLSVIISDKSWCDCKYHCNYFSISNFFFCQVGNKLLICIANVKQKKSIALRKSVSLRHNLCDKQDLNRFSIFS